MRSAGGGEPLERAISESRTIEPTDSGRLGINDPLIGSSLAAIWKLGWGKPSPAAEPTVSADPFCGDTPQRPERKSADGISVTG